MASKLALILFCIASTMQCAYAADETTNQNSSNPGDSARSVTLQRKWYSPHYIPIQYAGNIGFISTGLGYATRKDIYQFSLLYGYTPKSFTGTTIHTITVRNTFSIYPLPLNEMNMIIPYLGLGVSVEVGGRSFFRLPSTMPKGYYDAPKSVHMIVSGGLKLRHIPDQQKIFRGIEFFVETTTIDVYIWYKFISDEVKFNQIMSLSLGMNLLPK